jgi:hypothetical protein
MFGLFKKKEQYKFYQDEYDVWILLCKSKSNKNSHNEKARLKVF